jgi:hypothetical protein
VTDERTDRKEQDAMKIAELKTVVSKADADLIFSMTRSQWESYTKGLALPEGWKIRLDPSAEGTSVFAHDTIAGMALSIKPYYDNAIDPPEVLFIGRHYPLGKGPRFTADFKQNLEEKTKRDLGPGYSVSVAYTKSSSFEEVELIIKRAGK